MSDFIIPKGLDFDFTVKVIEQDSFLPQDVTSMTAGTFTLVAKATPEVSTGISCALSFIPDIIVETGNTTEYKVNGMLSGALTSLQTGELLYERGDKVDDYYLKPIYFGVITITFSDGTPSITTIIDNILIVPTGN